MNQIAAHICTQTGMTAVGVGSAFLSLSVYKVLSEVSPILKDICPIIYKHFPKLPEALKAFENAKKLIFAGIEWVEHHPWLPSEIKEIIREYVHIIVSPISYMDTFIKDTNGTSKDLVVVENFCDQAIETMKTVTFAFGIISGVITTANVVWNIYFVRFLSKHPTSTRQTMFTYSHV